MLTKKQIQLLEFIQSRMARDGVPPSFDEMKLALDLRSKSGIHRLVTALEERGFIRRLPHRARALEIVRLPEALLRGDSMIEAGINDGDVVVIREQDTAENGDIIVALVEGAEATLKRYRRRGGMIALEAANSAYETRVLPEDKVKVQGRLVGLIRSY